jgi:hypothetical protein
LWLRDIEQLMLEWDYDLNGDLDPQTLRASSHEVVAWQCLVNEDHIWEARVDERAYGKQCPYHMGTKVHPSESFAAYFPELVKEWHPTKNKLRPDEVTRASAHEVTWVCASGHEWPAAIYQRSLRLTKCPECDRLAQPGRAKLMAQRRRERADERAEDLLMRIDN